MLKSFIESYDESRFGMPLRIPSVGPAQLALVTKKFLRNKFPIKDLENKIERAQSPCDKNDGMANCVMVLVGMMTHLDLNLEEFSTTHLFNNDGKTYAVKLDLGQ